jgi:DNA primase
MLDSLMLAPRQRESLTARARKYAQEVDQLASYLSGRGIVREAAVGHLLGCAVDPEPQDERFAGMLSIPYLNAQNEVIALKFRRLDDGQPKYDSPSGQKAHLYNARSLAAGGEVALVCEGELDAIVAQQFGVPAVGTPGTTWLEHWSRCFGDFDKVLVVADHDVKDDGSSPGLKHAKKVQASIPSAELILPPAGLDLGEWILRDGAAAVRKGLGI